MNLTIGLNGATVQPPAVKESKLGQEYVQVHMNALEREVKRRHVQIIQRALLLVWKIFKNRKNVLIAVPIVGCSDSENKAYWCKTCSSKGY